MTDLGLITFRCLVDGEVVQEDSFPCPVGRIDSLSRSFVAGDDLVGSEVKVEFSFDPAAIVGKS